MKFLNQQTGEVKKWVIQQVEHISDADPDVLADYVLALLKSDIPDDKIRAQMLENLPDFLREHTAKFVDDIFARYTTKPVPISVPPTASAPGSPIYSPTDSPLPIEPYQGADRQASARSGNVDSRQSKKRSYIEYNGQGQQHNGTDRLTKSSRSGKGTRDRSSLPRSQYPSQIFPSTAFHTPLFSNLPRPPTPPPGFPAFDPTNPISSFVAMQVMFPNMTSTPKRSGKRCHDYDTKGFCVRGAACPHHHGNDHLVTPGGREYDPNNAIMDTNSRGQMNANMRSSQGEVSPRKPSRAVFSDPKIPRDRTLTAIVVEQIPEDYFDEEAVRDFFSQFGNIIGVTMHAYKHLAIVNYDNRSAAQRAFESFKVIFENRFVKVYWYRPDLDEKAKTNGRISKERSLSYAGTGSSPGLIMKEDPETVRRQQEEKQKVHEQRRAALKKLEEAKHALTRQTEELAKQDEEKAALVAKLAAKGVQIASDGTKEGTSSGTLALREQLARLEAEAKSMGIDPDAPVEEYAYGYRGRGRGRGVISRSYYGRGRGYTPCESTRRRYHGSPYVRGRSSAVRKLDNRPKNIAVSGVEFDSNKDELLRAYLVSVGEYDGIDRDPGKTDTMIISFKERWQAEQVMKGRTNIPGVGIVTLSWVASAPSTTTDPFATDRDDEVMAEAPNGANDKAHEVQDDSHHEQEVNLDVAGDDEWGGIE